MKTKHCRICGKENHTIGEHPVPEQAKYERMRATRKTVRYRNIKITAYIADNFIKCYGDMYPTGHPSFNILVDAMNRELERIVYAREKE